MIVISSFTDALQYEFSDLYGIGPDAAADFLAPYPAQHDVKGHKDRRAVSVAGRGLDIHTDISQAQSGEP